MTDSYLETLKREFKERRARIAAAAIDKPLPKKTIIEPEPEPLPSPEPPKPAPLMEFEASMPQFKHIVRAVCSYYRVSQDDIIDRGRSNKEVIPRHVIAYLASEYTSFSVNRIAYLMERDRSTTKYAISKIAHCPSDDKIWDDIAAIKASMGLS